MQLITALPRSQKFDLDLTQPGVSYDVDPKAGQIDFGRLVVRTSKGELPISSFLEKTGQTMNLDYSLTQSFPIQNVRLQVGLA